MLSNLPQWYQIAAIASINEETLEKRSLAITAMVSKEFPFILDCIRLYLNKPIKNREFNNEFFLAVNEADTMFLDSGNEMEKRVIAGAVVAESIKSDGDDSLKIASALVTGMFGIEAEKIINVDIVNTAIEFLSKKALEERRVKPKPWIPLKYPVLGAETDQTVETLTTHIKGLATYIKALASNVVDLRGSLTSRVDLLEEESNIHWWLFRSYSKLKKVKVSELNNEQAPLILALELADLFTVLPMTQNTEAYLNKALSEIKDMPQNLSIKQVSNIIYNQLTDIVEERDQELYGNLSPLYFAYATITELEGDDSWTAVFDKKTSIEAKYSCSTQDIAMQLLAETHLYHL